MRLAHLLPLLGLTALTAFGQQQASTEASLKGKWSVPDSKTSEAFTFNAGQEFVWNYTFVKKDSKPPESVSRQHEGAYTVGPSACSAGTEKGNLWVVQGSNRCCFNAHHMAKTLVLDQVRGGGAIFTMPLCESRTLKRAG